MIIGKIIDERYKVISKIAEGGMANIFLAHDSIFEKDVVLKVLKEEFNEQKYIEQFKHEVDSLAELNHENVVQVLDYRDIDDMHFIVMEYLDGITLKDLIRKKGKLSPELCVDIMVKVASGLKHAHSFNLIHRDLKPQNIMILKNANIKIMDFGISQHVEEVKAFNNGEENSVMGSVHYISPEQVKGSKIDLRSDIYALGIIMYEMLTGSVPYNGTSAVDIALMHLKQHIGNVSDVNVLVPQSLSNVIIRATSPDINLRHQDIQAFEYDLTTCLMPNRIHEEKLSFVDTTKEDSLSKTQKIDLNNAKIKEALEGDNRKSLLERSDDWDWKKIAIIGGIVTFLLMLLLFIYGFSTRQRMPNLIGKNLNEAKKIVRDELGFTLNDDNISYELTKNSSPKTIWQQFPNANESVSDQIHAGDFVLSVNDIKMENFHFKDYRGENFSNVSKELWKKHIKIKVEYVEQQTFDQKINHILEQSIAPNKMVSTGQNVTFSVVSSSSFVKLPKLTNYKLDDFLKFAKSKGLKSKSLNKINKNASNICYVNKYVNGSENKNFDKKVTLLYEVSCFKQVSWIENLANSLGFGNEKSKTLERQIMDANTNVVQKKKYARMEIWNSNLSIFKKVQALSKISVANSVNNINKILEETFR